MEFYRILQKFYRNFYHFNPQEGSTNNLFVVRQSRSSLSSPTQKYPLDSQKEDDLPALTPAEAIRMGMERNTYVSDSDRAVDSDRFDDPVPILSRKASRSCFSRRTNATRSSARRALASRRTSASASAASSSAERARDRRVDGGIAIGTC